MTRTKLKFFLTSITVFLLVAVLGFSWKLNDNSSKLSIEPNSASAGTVSAQSCKPTESVTYVFDCNPVDLGGGQGYCAQTLAQKTVSCDQGTCSATYDVGGCSAYPDCQVIGGHSNTTSCGGGPTPTGGGGGGGGCPAGTTPTSYEPPQFFCPNPGTCDGTTPNILVDPPEECGTTTNGNPKFKCEKRYCGVPTTAPTQPPVAQCQNIQAYMSDKTTSVWTLLTSAQLTQTKAGDTLYYCAAGAATSGSFDMARFTINGVLMPNTTLARPGSTDFCQLYTVPTGVFNFNIVAELHHTTLGWVK